MIVLLVLPHRGMRLCFFESSDGGEAGPFTEVDCFVLSRNGHREKGLLQLLKISHTNTHTLSLSFSIRRLSVEMLPLGILPESATSLS